MNKTVCRGAVHTMISVILPELTTFLLSPGYFCGRVTGSCSNKWITMDPNEFVEKQLESKPDFVEENNYIDTLYENMGTSP